MSRGQKKTLLILFSAFQIAFFMWAVNAYLIEQKAKNNNRSLQPLFPYEQARFYCYSVAATGLIAAIFWALIKLRTASASVFHGNFVYGLILTQISGFAGMVLFLCGSPLGEIWNFLIPSLAVNFVFYFPRILLR